MSSLQPTSAAKQAAGRQRILGVLLTLPLDKWVQYPLEDIEEAFPPMQDPWSGLRRGPEPVRPITTADQIDTICAREGLAYRVDPITERLTFSRRCISCQACNAIGTVNAADQNLRPTVCTSDDPCAWGVTATLDCIKCKGVGHVAAPREPSAIIMNGERVR